MGRGAGWRWVPPLQLLLHAAINAGTVYLFTMRPFRWPDRPDEWQRFMW